MKKVILIICLAFLSVFTSKINVVCNALTYDDMLEDYIHETEKGDSLGVWKIDGNTLSNTASASLNVFLNKKKLKAHETLVLESIINKSSISQGFVFGVKDAKNPLVNGYYSFMVKGSTARLDNYLNPNSIAEGNYLKSVSLKETYKMKIILTSSSRIRCYLDNELIFDIFDYEYQGGYFGFANLAGQTTFTNTKFSIVENPQALEDISIPELNFIYIPYLYGYECVVSEFKTINLSVTPKEGWQVSIDGEQTTSKQIVIDDKHTQVVILAQKDNAFTEYLIDIHVGYNDLMRPKYHKSMEKGWINDPNGLVYDEMTGLYHMFYQYTMSLNADVNGNKNQAGDGSTGKFTRSWAHSVSKDLVNWFDMPVAILPYNNGDIFSGSCIVDTNNSTGLFDDSDPNASRLVAIYTWYGPNWHHPINLSYSTDWGVTWENYGPVFDGSNDEYGDYRDPKVIWVMDEDKPNGGTWMMIFGGWTQIHLLTSDNLIDWQFNSKVRGFDGNEFIGECPDLVKVSDKATGEEKWMLTLAGEYYVIGDLIKNSDGMYEFICETPLLLLNNNRIIANRSWNKGCAYAGVTFNSEKHNRPIMVSWLVDYMSDYVADKFWNGYYTFPVELSLQKINGMYSVKKTPIAEAELLHGEELINLENVEIAENSSNPLANIDAKFADVDLKITLNDISSFTLTLMDNGTDYLKITYYVDEALMAVDYKSSGINCPWEDMAATGHIEASVLPTYGKISVRALLDKFAVDIFANEGSQVFYTYFWQHKEAKMTLSVSGGTALIDKLTVYEMEGIY